MSNVLSVEISSKQTLALDLLEDKVTTEVMYGGAAGGGKSWLLCLWQIQNRLKYKGSRGIILRKSLKDLMTITIDATFKEVAMLMGAGKYWNYTINSQKGTINFDNGSVIYLRDAAYNPSDPYYDRLKVEVTDAAIDEATQVPHKAYQMIKSRIRYMLDEIKLPPKLLICSNPGECWVKYEFIKDKKGNIIDLPINKKFVSAKLDDNPNNEFVKQYTETLSNLDPISKSMLLYGNWDINTNDNPFFYSFNLQRHTTLEKYTIDKDKPIQISFDFNANPCVCVLSQRIGKDINILDAISENQQSYAGLSPLQAVCQTIKRKYLNNGLIKPYYIQVTGDASGRSGSADRQNNNTFYTTICKELGLNPNQVCVRLANISHVMSGEICNTFLRVGNIKMYDCAELVSDLNRAYTDKDGTLNEAKKEHGLHLVDAFRYLIDLYASYTPNGFYNQIDKILNNINQYAK